MDHIIGDMRAALAAGGDPAIAEGTRRFFKEDVKSWGWRSADVKRLARDGVRVLRGRTKAEVFDLCGELWKSGYLEEAGIACEWAWSRRREFEPADFNTFERWVEFYVTNWAACDTLCNHTVGAFLDEFPQYLADLGRWALSGNRWMRRAAAVSLIVPAREGRFLLAVFQIADILLKDGDDLVRKGYGWMLKAASQAHPDEVFEYVMSHRAEMPRTALRYAIEKMPPEMRARAMRK